jgi:hypothetical protein
MNPAPTQLQNAINQLTVFMGEADIERRSLMRQLQQAAKRIEELETKLAAPAAEKD